MQESPLLVHVWEVDPAEEGVAVHRLDELFTGVVTDPGFVSAHVLEADDRSSVAAIVEMRSSEDRRRLEQMPEVRDALDNLPGTVNVVVRLYHQTASYKA